MLVISRKLVTLAFGTVAAVLSSCQTVPVETIPENADPTAQIDQLEKARDAALAQNVNSLAPKNWAEMNSQIDEAKHDRDSAADSKTILEHVALGKAYLKKANESAQVARSTFPDVIAARDAAVAAKAPDLMRSDFDPIEKDYKNATGKIEDGSLSVAENTRKDLKDRYSAVELKAIKQANLGHAWTTITQATGEDAEQWAPRSLAQAKAQVKQAEVFIDNNRHDTAGIAAQMKTANAAVDQLLTVTRQAKVAGKQDAESIVLNQQHTAAELAAEKAAVEKTAAEKAALEASSSATTAKLQTENSQLAAQQSFEKKYGAARARFLPNEAEVLRQGNNLLIRMKGLDFASGKAAIPPKNFNLLNKVVETAKDLGAAKITIEGHTDAVGSKKTNEKLSTERADAVVEYIAANGLDRSKITAVGYGDTRPLATNKTPDGRAQNRRVDVIIEPGTDLAGH